MIAGSTKAWFACPALGRTTEPWIWRQVTRLDKVAPTIICWGYENRDQFPIQTQVVHVLNFPPKPEHSTRRWIIRCQNSISGNFYGSVGAERQKISSLLAETQPSVMFCHYGHCALRMLPIAEKSHVPLVAQFNGLDLGSSLRNKWYRWSLTRSLPKFAAIVVLAEHQRQWMLDHGVPGDKVHLIPLGVPVEEYEVSRNVERQPCRFLSVGRFVEKKSPVDTLRAFATFGRDNDGVTLTMVGDGPLRKRAETVAIELGVHNRVNFTGSLTTEAMKDELSQASVFVQHSVTAENGDTEGWPVVIAEAAASGLPVISTRHGGIPQQVAEGRTGYLVEEHDWQSMGAAMERLARNPALRATLGANARELAQSKFGIQRQVRQLEDLLIQVSSYGGSKLGAARH